MSNAAPPVYQQIIDVTFAAEGNGKLSLDREDPGNWTGGAVGVGRLQGSRWGFSSAAFPSLDIEKLDRAQATGMAYAHFWLQAKCADMPDSLAVLVFDAAFQHGVSRAVEMLQRALGEHVDGDPGPVTMAALHAATANAACVKALCIAFQAQRLLHMVAQPSWQHDRDGLSYRLMTLMTVSAHFEAAPAGASA